MFEKRKHKSENEGEKNQTEFLKTKNVIKETKLYLIELMPLRHCRKKD